ncbi:MAG: RNA pseudouridine synthase [Saccharospirillaceae bacterium]|nr:pseudouridine synthase [Pseudomonadales bacterium]NRB78616.1 RNA pseudouridine synthase [Saccharospirillaceae bacterium]
MNKLNQYKGFDIIEDHTDFLIINKHTTINVHKTKDEKGLIDYIFEQFHIKVFLCHRLDKDTSGLMVLGKSSKSTGIISQLFADKTIQKRYVAISCDAPKKKQGKVVGDLVVSRNGNYKLTKTKENPSHTEFTSFNLIPKRRAWKLIPITGKTHQLRVVLKSLGSPILGDKRYSKDDAQRMYLHCFHLSFNYKNTDFSFDYLPLDLEFSLLKHLPNNWLSA